MTVKEEAQDVLDKLPDDVSWKDLMYKLYVRQKIVEGLQDVEAGRVVPHEEVVRSMEKWIQSSRQRRDEP